MEYIHNYAEPAIPPELLDAIYRQKCIVVVGSDMARHIVADDGRRPPKGIAFLENMVAWCLNKGLLDYQGAADVSNLLQAGFVCDAAQELEEVLSDRAKRQQCLREVTLSNVAKVRDVHLSLARIPFRAYFTSNYDTYVEDAYRLAMGADLPRFYEQSIDSALKRYEESRPFAFKLNGDIEDPNSIILGDRTYERLLHNSAEYRSFLQTLVMMSSVLFLGLGCMDLEFAGLVSKVASFNGRHNRHWIAVPEGDTPRLKAKWLLRNNGIGVIQYKLDEEGAGLQQFLRALIRDRPSSAAGDKIKSFEGTARSETFANNWALATDDSTEGGQSMTIKDELINVFYSYSHKDEDLRGELEKHLAILKRRGVISSWHDRNIDAGNEWETEISEHLEVAQIVLLCVSADFIASDYCYEKEMKRAMERHDVGEAVVIPVVFRAVDWKGAPFGKLQALPKNALAVTSWPNRDEAFTNVAEGIRKVAEEIKAGTRKVRGVK